MEADYNRASWRYVVMSARHIHKLRTMCIALPAAIQGVAFQAVSADMTPANTANLTWDTAYSLQ